MSTIVGILHYGKGGNTLNVQKAFEKSGAKTKILKKEQDFSAVDKIVIPGVGTFKAAMNNLESLNLKHTLLEQIKIKPTLGICLGMQILAKIGFEFGETLGINAIDGEVRKIPIKEKIPHLGWAKLNIIKDSPLLKGITPDDYFYFMHSYEFINYTDIIALSEYCSHKFVSIVQKDNIFGVQFHPEKSRNTGLTIIKNFLKI